MRRLISLNLLLVSLAAATAFAQVETEPLYRYKSSESNWIFTTSPSLPPGLSGQWKREEVVCHVPKPSELTKPIYSLVKADNLGVRYAYTSSASETAAGWQRQDAPAFHVAKTQLPGTTALYRLYAPLRTAGDPDGFSGPVAGTDTHYYTADKYERRSALDAGWVSQGILGYVWTAPQVLPDLVIQKADADQSSVTALIRNQGKANTGGAIYEATLTIYDRNGATVKTLTERGPSLSPNQSAPVVFDTGSLAGLRYRVSLDGGNVVAESNEGNNVGATLDGPARKIQIKANPNAPDAPRPSFRMTAGQPHANGRMRYTLKVTNADAYPAAWFVKAGPGLPPNPCGDARLIARILVIHGGKRSEAACKALTSPAALQSLELVHASALADDDEVQVIVEDRLLREHYVSERVKAGWSDLGPLLASAGCKSFLGRASSYLCTTDKGFAACESIRQSGKPIECRRAGK